MRRVTRRRKEAWVLAVVILAQLLVACGGGSSGSGGQPPPPPPASNPVPAIVSLRPNSANAGGAALTVTITGYNFLSSSTVQWNGSMRTVTYMSGTQLEVQITASDIASSGLATLSVANPIPGGGNSGAAEFTINPLTNPPPTVSSITPTSVDAGSSGFILTIYGSNFLPASVIEWNGAPVPTSYLSDSQVEAQIPASSLANPGAANITVVNPAPGGGTSAPQFFGINYLPTVVNQLANDMVWDPTHQVIYLSVPSLASSNGNMIATLDPVSGTVQSTQFAGSEPDVLAISDDASYLYAGMDGSSSVQRFILPGMTPDIDYLLGAGPYPEGPFFGMDLQVAPGLPHTTAVSRGSFTTIPVALGGMAIFDDATQRPTIADASGDLYDSLQWGSDSQIYAINSEVTSFNFYVLSVNSGGVTLTNNYPYEFSDFYVRLHCDSDTGYCYTDDGYVINPANGQRVGQFQAAGYMVPDSILNRAFFLGQTQSQSGSTSFTIASFNLTTLAPISEITIPYVQGYPLQFIRWGASGLAFNDNAGFVYIINSPIVSGDEQVKPASIFYPLRRSWPNSKFRLREKLDARIRHSETASIRRLIAHAQDSNPAPSITALNPNAITTGAVALNGFTLTVTGTNFVSLSTVEWNGSARQTEFFSSTELQAQINFQDVFNTGTSSVSVLTPGPGGGASNVLTFSVVPSASLPPIPYILALNPNSAIAGSGGLLVDVNGIAIDNSDAADWNGSSRTNISQGFLAAQVYASDLVTPGYAQVTVVTPGGVVSNAAEFQILYQPTAVNQSTNDMVWDPVNQVFYISIPSSASANANRVCVFNPTNLTITNCQAGSEPDVLAIADDSSYLYVGMDGTGSVQRFVLPSLTPDISYSLGDYETGDPYFALDLQVEPGAPGTTAVSKGANVDPESQGGITIYDGSTPRPNSTTGCGVPGGQCADSIQWNSDGTQIYAANSDSTEFDFYTNTVDSSGVTQQQDYPSVFWNEPGRIQYDSNNGLIYSEDGFHVVNPATGLPAGFLEGGAPVAPDSSLNTVFELVQYLWQGNTNYTIELFDMTHYVPIGGIPFPTTANVGLNPPIRLLRWGSNGLALNFKGDQIYLLTGSFISNPQKARAKQIRKTVRAR